MSLMYLQVPLISPLGVSAMGSLGVQPEELNAPLLQAHQLHHPFITNITVQYH
jgi:hypothetical protein